jgi:2-dehydropantoate 2-reductase
MSAHLTVLGPGGVGGFLAAALALDGHAVEVVARPSSAATIGREGIRLRSALLGEQTVPVAARERSDRSGGILFVAVKATSLEAALERVAGLPALVIPLLNGVEHLARLRARFGQERVAAASIRIESDRPAPGVVVQSSPAARIDLAAEDPSLAERLPPVVELLERAGLQARIDDEGEAHCLWSKLVRLNALASTTAAADLPLGEIRRDPRWRERLFACVAETAAVARAQGARLEAAETIAELEAAPATLGSSMQRDLAAGREPELDAIQGAVLRAARRHGLGAPTVATLAAEIARRAGIPPPSA